MAIVNDPENERVIDLETGEYLKWSTADREDRTAFYTIHGPDDVIVLASEVRRRGISEHNDGIATIVRHELLKAWTPADQPKSLDFFTSKQPETFLEDHILIDKLCEFLRVKKYYNGKKNPDPVFEFVDVRDRNGDGL